MKKAELIGSIVEKTGLSKTDADKFLTAFAETITENIKSDSIAIPNLGTFKLRTNKAKEGINPATKEKIQIKESVGLAFKQSSKVKTVLNG